MVERSGFMCRKGYLWLKPTLDDWVRRIERYGTRWSGLAGDERDAAYWYNERATVSTLLASFAASGADVLAEYDCLRDDAQGNGSRRGRTDMWISLQRIEAVIEAKQVWPADAVSLVALSRSALRNAASQLHSAESQAGNRAHLLSVVFAVPRVHESVGVDWESFVRAMEAAVDGRRTNEPVSANAWAWCFPKSAQALRGHRAPEFLFPGIVVFVCEEERRNR